ncbi:hypothetical protein B472_11640 [Limnohabitans sp. Rim28]|nr:hypothetical protein B472_11640 [Limnohabitans sp. Rim28]
MVRASAQALNFLTNDGQRDSVAVVPRPFLLDATDPARQLFAFALQGIHGQHTFVQPKSGILKRLGGASA